MVTARRELGERYRYVDQMKVLLCTLLYSISFCFAHIIIFNCSLQIYNCITFLYFSPYSKIQDTLWILFNPVLLWKMIFVWFSFSQKRCKFKSSHQMYPKMCKTTFIQSFTVCVWCGCGITITKPNLLESERCTIVKTNIKS